MRALMTATVPSMIGQFNLNNIKLLLKLGYDVDVACNMKDCSVWSEEKIHLFKATLDEMGVVVFQIDFSRNASNLFSHIQAYKQMLYLLNNREYDLIHTHTPISSLLTRIAFKNSNIFYKCRMIYTAHGFHFFAGNNPVKNFMFEKIERYGAKYTDTLITINSEDYEAAKNFKLREHGKVFYVPGVGINLENIQSIQGSKKELCAELEIQSNSLLVLSVGELNENKNHRVVIEALPNLPKNIHYVICGIGGLREEYERLAKKLLIEDRVHLLGYRTDIIRIMKSSDMFVFPSRREGLSVALMEAMACGLPCVVSDIRGNRDLVKDDDNNILIDQFRNVADCISRCIALNSQSFFPSDLPKLKKNILFIENFSSRRIQAQMSDIYNEKRL